MAVDPDLLVKGGVWIARLLRLVGAKGVVGAIRRRASREFSKTLFSEILLPLQGLSMAASARELDRRQVVEKLTEFSTGCRFLMCQLSEANENQIHSCVKVLMKGKSDELDSVHTFARSNPLDGRATSDDAIHYVGANTVWSALLGKHDGQYKWRLFNCFACNDLTKPGEEFRCSRADWRRYYKSTVVFPLLYPDRRQHQKFDIFGFLAFDSDKSGMFKGLPDIFEHKSEWSVYHDVLNKSAIFNFGSAVATSLAIALRPLYERGRISGAINGPQEERKVLE